MSTFQLLEALWRIWLSIDDAILSMRHESYIEPASGNSGRKANAMRMVK